MDAETKILVVSDNESGKIVFRCKSNGAMDAVLRICICTDTHDFCLLDSNQESAFQMRVPDADADPDPAIQKFRNSEICITNTIINPVLSDKN